MSLRLAFYGEQLSPLLETLEHLACAGVETRLCLTPPESLTLDLEALGLWSASPTTLLPLRAPLHHALTTPESLGAALEASTKVLGASAVPILFGAPSQGDFVAFRSLHHQRYPEALWSITRQEADLAVTLHHQTQAFSLYDISCLYLDSGRDAVKARLREIQADPEPSVVFFDSLSPAHTALIGEMLWERKPPLIVGSLSVEEALLAAWRAAKLLPEHAPQPCPEPVAQVLVALASSAPELAAQQDQARTQGFFCHTFRDTARALKVAEGALSVGHSVSLYTSDETLAPELARTVKILQKTRPQQRLALSASVACTPELEIAALEWIAKLAPGCPLCRVVGGVLEGCELVVQAERSGPEAFLPQIRQGTSL